MAVSGHNTNKINHTVCFALCQLATDELSPCLRSIEAIVTDQGYQQTQVAARVLKLNLLEAFHRARGTKIREATRTLPDGGWVNPALNEPGEYRLPQPPTKSVTHSDLSRR